MNIDEYLPESLVMDFNTFIGLNESKKYGFTDSDVKVLKAHGFDIMDDDLARKDNIDIIVVNATNLSAFRYKLIVNGVTPYESKILDGVSIAIEMSAEHTYKYKSKSK